MSAKRRLIEAVEVTDEGIHIVRLMKVFDASSLDEFEKVLAYLLSRDHYRIVVDLTSVEFISSAGWGAFTAELRRVRDNGGDIRLAGMNPDVLDVFLLLELDSFINAYDTIDDAIVSFDAATSYPPRQDLSAGTVAHAAPPEPAVPSQDAYDSSFLPHALEREDDDDGESHADVFAAGFGQYASSSRAEKPEALDEDVPLASPNEASGSELLSDMGDEFFDWSPYGSGGAATIENKRATSSEKFDALPPAGFDGEELPFRESVTRSDEVAPAHGMMEDSREPGDASMWADDFADEEHEHEPPAAPLRAAAPKFHDTAEPQRFGNEPEVSARTEQFYDEFVSQDINDPWILDEIDTLPEEYEIEDVNWRDDSDFAEKPSRFAPPFLEGGRDAPGGVTATNPAAVKNARTGSDNSAPAKQAAPQKLAPKNYMPAWLTQKSRLATVVTAEQATDNGVRQALSSRESFLFGASSTPLPSGEMPATVAPVAYIDEREVQTIHRGPQPIRRSQATQRMQFEGDRPALIRQIVSEHPHYGPTMIQKFLEVRTDPAISVSRSTVYRWLRQVELNTREQRLQFAGRATTN